MRGAKRWPGAMASRSSQIDTCAGSGSVSRRTSALLSLAWLRKIFIVGRL